MALALRGAAVVPTGNPTTGFTLVIPSQVVADDLLFLVLTSRDHTNLLAYPTVTDDDAIGGNLWSLIGEAADRTALLFYKRATAGTASKTITVADCRGSSSGVLKAFSGGDTGATPYSNITVEVNASGDESSAGFTPAVADSMICAFVRNIDNLAVTSLAFATAGSTTMTESLSTGGLDCASAFGHVLQSGGPTATGGLTWAQTNGATITIVWAIKPFVDLTQAVTGGNRATAKALNAPTVATGAVTVAGGNRASAISLNAPTVTPITAITGAHRASAKALFAPTVTVGAVTIVGDTRTSTKTLFAPILAPGPVTVVGATRASGLVLTAPTVTQGGITVEAAHRSSARVLNAPTVTVGAVTVTGANRASARILNAPTVVPGAVTVVGANRASTHTLFAPEIALVGGGAQAVTGSHRASALAISPPSLTVGAVTIVGSHRTSAKLLFAPTISFTQFVTAPHRASGLLLFAPSVVAVVPWLFGAALSFEDPASVRSTMSIDPALTGGATESTATRPTGSSRPGSGSGMSGAGLGGR